MRVCAHWSVCIPAYICAVWLSPPVVPVSLNGRQAQHSGVVVLRGNAHLCCHIRLGSAPHDAPGDRAQQPQQFTHTCQRRRGHDTVHTNWVSTQTLC